MVCKYHFQHTTRWAIFPVGYLPVGYLPAGYLLVGCSPRFDRRRGGLVLRTDVWDEEDESEGNCDDGEREGDDGGGGCLRRREDVLDGELETEWGGRVREHALQHAHDVEQRCTDARTSHAHHRTHITRTCPHGIISQSAQYIRKL